MRLLKHDEDQIDVRLTPDDLILLRDAVRLLCDSLDFGSQRHEAEALLRRIESTLDQSGFASSFD